ncbi:MAG: c-type cytochrome domain-containing protein [Opitutales bacterium]
MRVLPTLLGGACLAAAAFAAPPTRKDAPKVTLSRSDFSSVIAPILDARCVSCHGPKKVKGKLRLDSYDAMMKGGKNGAAFVPGRPDTSMLLARVFLHPGAGDLMPPKEEKQLTEAQKEAMYTWIEGRPIPAALAKTAKDGLKAAPAKDDANR